MCTGCAKYSTFSVRLGQTTACIAISLSLIVDYTHQDQRQIDTCLGDPYYLYKVHLLKPYTRGCPSPGHKSTCIYTCVAIPIARFASFGTFSASEYYLSGV